MGSRDLKFLAVTILTVLGTSLSSIRAVDGIHCEDFTKIFDFTATEHLRFKTEGTFRAVQLLRDATDKIASELSTQGYNLLAAQFNADSNAGSKFKNFSTAKQICEALPSGIHRAILLKAYVASLDPFSEFYMAEELPKRTSVVDGHFVGVGIGTENEDPYIRVEEVVEGGPSDGLLKVGDLISHVDGYPVRGMDASELRRRMRGEVGSKVLITGKRPLVKSSKDSPTEDLRVEVIRNHVYQTSVSSHWADKNILQIKVSRFFAQTAPQVKEILEKERGKAKGLILDLRDNPGGLLQAARDLVDLFISKGVVIHLRGSYEDQMWAYQDGGHTKIPMVVLVNERSASASEIVAGALQDYGRAMLVGTKTYGKSCIQNIYETKNGIGTDYEGGVKLTTLWYYLPSGKSVRVLNPDVPLASTSIEKVEHAVLPYEWPDHIQVLDPNTHSFGKLKKFAKRANHSFAKDMSPEEAGRALLRMMALSN